MLGATLSRALPLVNPDTPQNWTPPPAPAQPNYFPASVQMPQTGAATPQIPLPALSPIPSAAPTPAPQPEGQDFKPPEIQVDPHAQIFLDHADELQKAAAAINPPRMAGLNVGQFLAGALGAALTSNNPHAQFIAQYLPQVQAENQAKFGNDQQAWEASRQNLLSQAQAMRDRASGLQKFALEKYASDTSYGKALQVQQMKGQTAEAVQASKAKSAAAVAALRANPVIARDAIALFNSGVPAARGRALDMLDQIPGFGDTSPEDRAKMIAEMAPKDQKFIADAALAVSRGDQAKANAELAKAKAATEKATLQPRIDRIKSQTGVDDATAEKLAAQTKDIPEAAAVRLARANAYAMSVKSQAQRRQDQTGYDYAKLTVLQNIAMQRMLGKDMDNIRAQADTLRNERGRTAAIQATLVPGTDQYKANDATIKAYDGTINEYKKTFNDLHDRMMGLKETPPAYDDTPPPVQQPAPSTATPGTPGFVGPIGPGHGGLPVPDGFNDRFNLTKVKPRSGASNAVNQANKAVQRTRSGNRYRVVQ